MKSRLVSNRVFSFVLLGTILISLFAFSDAFAAQTVNDRKIINSTSFGLPPDLANGDLFGYQIEAIGDLNSDGVTDLATILFSDDFVGATPEANVGSIFILFMNSDGTVDSANAIFMDGSTNGLNGCIADNSDNRDTGSLEQLAFVGDLDGDGMPTLALGANSNDHPIANSGAVYMLELMSNGKVDNCVLITEDSGGFDPGAGVYRQSGEGQAANFGWPVIATDLNNDGQNELIVGATSDDDNNTDLWVLFLNSSGGVDSHPAVPIFGNATEIGIDSGIYIDDGKSVNGGQKIVLGVTEAGDDGGGVFIVNLNSAGGFVSSSEIEEFMLGIPNDQKFGSGVAPLGDMDGDGVNDILVGNEAGDDTNSLSGEAYIVFLNSDDSLKEFQKISNESENIRNGSTPFGASDLFGHGMSVWLSSSTEIVMAISATQNDDGGSNRGAIHLFYIEITSPVTITKKGSGGCDDCTPPTMGLNSDGVRKVEAGFNYNGNIVDVGHFYTEFPLINATVGELNSVQVKIYENGGIANNKWVQFGLGVKEVRDPVNDSEVIILVILHQNGTAVELIDIVDKENLIENDSVFATVYPIKCKVLSNNEDCILVTLVYSYREAPEYNIMLVNTVDDKRNGWTFYFNDGIKVIGKSLNEPPTTKQFFKNGSQDKDVWYTLTRTDKIKDIWTDQNGIEYQNNNGAFDRITPYEPWTCKDKPLDQINVPTRQNCNFRALTTIWG